MAGAGALGQQGLSQNSVPLPVSATVPVYPCSPTTCNYINGAPVAYPVQSGARYLYSIVPGPNLGMPSTDSRPTFLACPTPMLTWR